MLELGNVPTVAKAVKSRDPFDRPDDPMVAIWTSP
jgi:hypothetical protein